MKITALTLQKQDPNRINVMVDGKYRFSLDIFQVGSLGIKVGREYDETELLGLEAESQFGKLYMRSLEYCLMRPHSSKEMRDYLYRKTRPSKFKSRRTGEIKDRPGVSQELTERVYERLREKGYINDEKFTRFWVENRNRTKGISQRKLQAELMAKGVERSIIDSQLKDGDRSDKDELRKMIFKKKNRYEDEEKLMGYLLRQGFSYTDVKSALSENTD